MDAGLEEAVPVHAEPSGSAIDFLEILNTARPAEALPHATADGVILEARQDSGMLLIAGQPLGEPIAQHGPFVMNTQDQIKQAIADYQAGRLA